MWVLPFEVELPGAARRSLVAVALASGVSLSVRKAAADEAVRLDYRAPVECPDAPVFIERVRKRVPSARMAAPDELAREVVVVVSMDEEGFMARLDFVDVHGETITRTLSGKACDEVVSGIALVTALALEVQRELSNRALDSAPPVPPASPGDTMVEGATPAPPAPAASETVNPPALPGPERASSPPPRPRLKPPRFLHGTGVGGGNAWFVAPGTPAVFDAVFRLAHTSLTGSLRAGFRGWVSSVTVGGRSADFLGYTGSLEGCPVVWPRVGRVRFEPCVGTTLGVLEGEGDQSDQLAITESSRIFWADVRGIARLRLALTRLVELEGQGELGVPLRTHRFLFQNPEQTVFEVPRIGLGWRAGVMLHFP
jgi:hypothetical protein